MFVALRTEADIATGFYGKLPATGDFVSRRLPPAFVKQWDAWLQECLQGSRARLGEAWTESYFTAPIWRFALLPGVCGESGWSGVLMPSVDKVGRAFPLTLAAPFNAATGAASALFAGESWYARLEEVALSALEVEVRVETFDEDVLGISIAHATADPGATPALAQTTEMPIMLSSVDGFGVALGAAALEALAAASGGRSYWWTRGRSEGHAAAFMSAALPAVRTFTSMLSV